MMFEEREEANEQQPGRDHAGAQLNEGWHRSLVLEMRSTRHARASQDRSL